MSSEISSVNAPRPPMAPSVSHEAAPAVAQAVHPVAASTKPAVQELQEKQANIREALERLNQQMRKDGRKLNFAMDEVVDRVVITVRQAETGEVIRQIPDEALLRVAHNIEALKGLLHNQTT